jgi:diguanylate cyclase (GGDEF)-like protein
VVSLLIAHACGAAHGGNPVTASRESITARDTAPPHTRPAAGAATPHDWISHSLRHLERWVAWSIAVYTAWLAVFAFPAVPVLWAFVLYAGLIGKWAEARPARHQSEMAVRGIALIAGAYVLHTYTEPAIGGPTGLFFFWLSITSLYYAFMLKPAWAAAVAGSALLAFTLSFVQGPLPGSLAEFMAHAGFLCIFPLLLAMRFGAVMRAPDDVLEHERIDNSTELYNKTGFTVHGDDLLAACRRDNRPLSVAVFDCADLLEVRSIYGSRVARKLIARIAGKLNSLSGDHGLAARTGPAEFSVVLPGMAREKALAAIARVLGSPLRIELDAGDSEIVLVPNFLVERAGADTGSVDEIHQELQRELAQIGDQQQRRCQYLQRERERHSRPMIDALDSESPKTRGTHVDIARTMPAPLVAN